MSPAIPSPAVGAVRDAAGPPPGPKPRKWLARTVQLGVLVLVVGFVAVKLHKSWGDLQEHSWRADPLWLVLAGLIYLAALVPAGVFWHRVLRALGQEARLGETLRAYYIGHLGKYVPGKAMVVVLRAGLIRGYRVDTTVAAVSVFVETLTLISVGSFLAAVYVALHAAGRWPLVAGAALLMAAAGLPTFPPVFRRLVRVLRIGRGNPAVREKLDRLGYGTIALGWALMTVSWIAMGVGVWAALRGMCLQNLDLIGQLPCYTAGMALATVAGFFVFFVPAGLGVRDVMLSQFLEMEVPLGAMDALVAAVLLRLIALVSEAVLAGIVYVAGLRAARLRLNPPQGKQSP